MCMGFVYMFAHQVYAVPLKATREEQPVFSMVFCLLLMIDLKTELPALLFCDISMSQTEEKNVYKIM